MDTITHALLGAATAQAGFRQRIGRSAGWVAAGAAAAPDLDVFFPHIFRAMGLSDDSLSVAWRHRGITHSLLFVPLMALAGAGLWWWVGGLVRRLKSPPLSAENPRPAFKLLFACLLVAMLTHPVLDVCTSYGTQLLSPLNDYRFAIDAIGIVDIIFTPLLIVTLVACWILNRKSATAGRRAARVGLALAAMYLLAGFSAGRYLEHHYAEPGISAVRAYPQVGAVWLWRVTRRHDDGAWDVRRVNLLHPGRDYGVLSAPSTDGQWVRRARELPPVKSFYWFAGDEVRCDMHQEDGLPAVDFHDMRYGPRPESPESMWVLRVVFGPDGQTRVYPFHHMRGRSMPDMVRQGWRDLWN